MSNALLFIEGLSVEFNTPIGWSQVTYDVSFAIQRGKTLALVGESGSGKSVTSMAILNLLPPNTRRTGRVVFGGTDLTRLKENQLRKFRGSEIATIFQEPMTALNPVYTIGSQLVAALRSHRNITKAQARARAADLLRRVHMPEPEEKLDVYPHQLSGGQRQRAMIAMAISSGPTLLVADEPTTALDVTVQGEILDLIRELQKSLNMAVLIITHDMGVVADVADDVVVMKDGRVVETARSRALFKNPEEEYTKKLLSAVPRLGQTQGFLSSTNDARRVEDEKSLTVVPESVLKLNEAIVTYPGKWRRPGFQAVNGIDLEVSSGEIVGLVGESGSGKSTIGKAIVGLLPITHGQMEVSGKAITGSGRQGRAELRKNVAMIFQDPASSLNPRRTIGQAIADPLTWQGLVKDPRERRVRAKQLLSQVQLDPDWVDRYPHELSGGQRQRIGIARAIGTNPKLMIADEPTSALDVSVQVQVLDLFLGLQRELGFSCLFISHDLSVVETLSNRVVVLRQGDVVEQGPTEEILHSPKDDYTKRLIAAAPIPDPEIQQQRRISRQKCGTK